MKKYLRKNPDVFEKANVKQLKKYSDYSGIPPRNLRHMRQTWSKLIKKRDNDECQICKSSKNLQSHHIIFQHVQPKLLLNLNNGITLCLKHHNEVHNKLL